MHSPHRHHQCQPIYAFLSKAMNVTGEARNTMMTKPQKKHRSASAIRCTVHNIDTTKHHIHKIWPKTSNPYALKTENKWRPALAHNLRGLCQSGFYTRSISTQQYTQYQAKSILIDRTSRIHSRELPSKLCLAPCRTHLTNSRPHVTSNVWLHFMFFLLAICWVHTRCSYSTTQKWVDEEKTIFAPSTHSISYLLGQTKDKTLRDKFVRKDV